jgi:type III pantothenate kinase
MVTLVASRPMDLLALDVGNTRLKWGLYGPGRELRHQGAVFLETIDDLAETEWAGLPPPRRILGCIVAGEAARRRVEEQLGLWCGGEDDPPLRWVVPSAQEAGVTNGYDHPSRLGADRWVAMIGARGRVLAAGPPRPALVVMVGTAVTVDALDADGRFLGGLILPGFGLMLKALEMGTAGLRVPTGEVVDFPTNTSDALMSGGAHALAGAIERQARRLRQRTGAEPMLVMSGGAAVKLAPITDLPFETVDTLIFDGLLRIDAEQG